MCVLLSIEAIEQQAQSVPRYTGGFWIVSPVIEDRLYIGRDGENRTSIFMLGSKESFGAYLTRPSFEFRDELQTPHGNSHAGAKISFEASPEASRAACHVAVELAEALETDPGENSSNVLDTISWLLDLMETHWSLMNGERAIGLAGECVLLQQLASECLSQGAPVRRAVEAWHGATPAARDFAANGVAIEVKATARPERKHRIGSIPQLVEGDAEGLYLFSLGLKRDPSGGRPLSAFVDDVFQHLIDASGNPDGTARALFREKLESYGFRQDLANSYDRAHRFLAPHLRAGLYPVPDLHPLTNQDFKHEDPPSHISRIAYDLFIHQTALSRTDRNRVFRQLLGLAD